MAITSAKESQNQAKLLVNTNSLAPGNFSSLLGFPGLANTAAYWPQGPNNTYDLNHSYAPQNAAPAINSKPKIKKNDRNSAEKIALKSPQKRFQKVNLDELEKQPEAVKNLVKEYEPIDAFINKTGDRMVLNLTGDSIRDNLFETGFVSTIANIFRKLFGAETTSVGLEEYKKLFYSDGNHQGESPETLINNLKHSIEKKGGHYYGQASFKLEDGKFKIDTITITDSAYFAGKQLIGQGLVPPGTDLKPFEKTYFIKYIIPVRADFRTTKISEKTSEIIDTLISNKPDQFDTFIVVGSDKPNPLGEFHSFKNIPWKFPLVNDSGKWSHIDGHLSFVRHMSNPVVFNEALAEILAEMQTAYGGETRHPDKKFFQTCVDFNKVNLSL